MGRKSKDELAELLLTLVPPDGATIGNHRLCQDLGERLGREVSEAEYETVKGLLLERSDLMRGQGRGGSVRRWCRDVVFDPAQTLDRLVLHGGK